MNIDTQPLITISAAGAGTYTTGDLPNSQWSQISVVVNLTTVTSASVVVTISGKDAASGAYYPILTSQAITQAGITALQIAPGLLSTGTTAPGVLPNTYRISVAITGASASVTGTIGASLIQ